MKHLRMAVGALLLWTAAAVSGAIAPYGAPLGRTNINPALIYWQAIGEMPDLSEADHGYVFTNEWRGRPLEARLETLLGKYDVSFRLLQQGRRQLVPCEWGHDLSLGPELYLPGLAKAKALAQTVKLRARWHLEHQRPEAARDELLAEFALARQLSRDRVLISALVQLAIENIVASSLAENWFRCSPETLQQIFAGMDAAPPRGRVQECMGVERHSFRDWYIRRLETLQAESNSDAEVMRQAGEMLRSMDEERPDLADRVLRACGGTSAGLIRYLKELDPLYDEAHDLVGLPYAEYQVRIKAFDEKIRTHPNIFAQVFFPALGKCRTKEFIADVKQAMLRAALEYRRSGLPGLARVPDPLTGETFEIERFAFDGVDRGFKLRSSAPLFTWPNVLIFVEKDGPAFNLEGPRAGKAPQ